MQDAQIATTNEIASHISEDTKSATATTKAPVRFTQEEDTYLREGIEKFGYRWSEILKCPLYQFERSRVARTLRKRAVSLKLI